ncbi:MAG: phosphotransferase family protein [Natrialbaceae archaeon]
MSDSVPEDALATALRLVDEEYRLVDAEPIDRGRSRLYRLRAKRRGEVETLVFKAAPPGEETDPGISTDARLLSLLGERTSIPVPRVRGIVDDHPTVPTPALLMDELDGNEKPYEAIARFDDSALETFAERMGAYLGELHGIDCLDAYGHVRPAGEETLQGELPDDPAAALTTSGIDSWSTFLERWSERELERHAESRFDSLTSELRRWIERRRADQQDAVGPVLGRNDHGLHNLLVDPASGEITAVLDWAYTLGVAPSFDFEYAAYLYSGAFLAGLPAVSDRRDPVRAAMLSGYRSTAPEPAARAVAEPQPLYQLLAMIRVMNDFELLDLPNDGTAEVAEGLAADARALIDDGA